MTLNASNTTRAGSVSDGRFAVANASGSLRCAIVGLGLLYCASILVSPCAAQAPQAASILKTGSSALDADGYGQRTDAFRRLLFELRFQPLSLFAELENEPSKSLFIMLGDPKCLSRVYLKDGLRPFVEQGGAVLIATDMKTEGEAGDELRQLAGVTVTGETLVCLPGASGELYNASLYCPFVQPSEDISALKKTPNILGMLTAFAGMEGQPALFRNPHPDQPDLRVATNAPSRLTEPRRWLRVPRLGQPWQIARLPSLCQDEKKRSIFVDREGPLFAVGATVGKGRVLVLADHSIFINRMILPRDNGNLEFAANCLHWLRGGVSSPQEALRAVNSPDPRSQLTGQRDQVLFWDDGTIRPDFNVPLKKVPKPPLTPSEPAIVAAIDKTIAKLESRDYFNHALLDQIDELPGGRSRVVRYAVYLLTLAVALLLGYLFLWRSRHRLDAAVPSLAHALREHEPRASLLDQRRRALLRSGNVWEMGHRLAREYFESAGVALTTASPPRVQMAQGSRWQRWRIARRITRLWRLARGDAPTPISPVAFKRLLRELEQLKTALADGTIMLTISEANRQR